MEYDVNHSTRSITDEGDMDIVTIVYAILLAIFAYNLLRFILINLQIISPIFHDFTLKPFKTWILWSLCKIGYKLYKIIVTHTLSNDLRYRYIEESLKDSEYIVSLVKRGGLPKDIRF